MHEEFVASHPPAEEPFSQEDLAKLEEIKTQEAQEAQPENPERPQWLPEKFKSP